MLAMVLNEWDKLPASAQDPLRVEANEKLRI